MKRIKYWYLRNAPRFMVGERYRAPFLDDVYSLGETITLQGEDLNGTFIYLGNQMILLKHLNV